MNRSAWIILSGLALFTIGAFTGRAFGSGRYQIVFSPHNVSDTFLVDTATGRIWRDKKFVAYEGDPEGWETEHRFDAEPEWTLKKKAE
jgi:hypothetical protein